MRETTGISRFEVGTEIWNRSGGVRQNLVVNQMIDTRPAEREDQRQRLTAIVGM